MIFIDADAFIALNHPLDAHFQKATSIYLSLQKSDEELVTSWEVIDEVSSKLSAFLTKRIALLFLDTVFNSQIRVEFVGPILTKKVIKQFIDQNSKRVSLTDCSNMVIAKELGIKRFFSFDQHYQKNGFELLK